MKLLERRIASLESRVPKKDDEAAAVSEMLTWALSPELDAFRNLIERHHSGQPAAGDDALLDELTARWNSRCADPAIEVNHVHDATRRWLRDPDRRLLGRRWIDWLNAFDTRDEAGETSADDWSTWRRLMAAVDRYIVRQSPLPPGVNWSPGEAMPASLIGATEEEARRR